MTKSFHCLEKFINAPNIKNNVPPNEELYSNLKKYILLFLVNLESISSVHWAFIHSENIYSKSTMYKTETGLLNFAMKEYVVNIQIVI